MSGGAAAAVMAANRRTQASRSIQLKPNEQYYQVSGVYPKENNKLFVLLYDNVDSNELKRVKEWVPLDDFLATHFSSATIKRIAYNNVMHTVDVVYTGSIDNEDDIEYNEVTTEELGFNFFGLLNIFMIVMMVLAGISGLGIFIMMLL